MSLWSIEGQHDSRQPALGIKTLLREQSTTRVREEGHHVAMPAKRPSRLCNTVSPHLIKHLIEFGEDGAWVDLVFINDGRECYVDKDCTCL